MDKRRQNTLEEVRKKIGLQMQDRRNFLNCLLNIENIEKSIELKKEHIEQMKSQSQTGIIFEKDKHGTPMTKEQLNREIVFFEFQLKQLCLNLDYSKEDLYFLLHINEGVLQKAGSLEELKEKVNSHFNLMREEYNQTIEVLKDVI